MGEHKERAYRAITKLMPKPVAGRVDRYRPSFAASWGGPLNGQDHRRRIVRDLARTIAFDRVFETGTYRGTSTEFFAAVFDAPIETVEASPRFFTYSSLRLAPYPNITIECGDSRGFLRRAAEKHSNETVFVYLDAHWQDDLPLAEELDIISSGWSRAVVMIDDFEVPGDSGYGFDDYGPGLALTAAYLPPSVADWRLFYPSARSDDETGAKRGCCVLSSPGLSVDVPSLRPA
jgi:predicted O-methyltransferase YrrM